MTELGNCELSIIIPTYGRERVLIDTLTALVRLVSGDTEIVVVDQTPHHQTKVAAQLEDWHAVGAIRWLRQPEPSIPAAMNCGALAARGDVLLYLDDDIVPHSRLLAAHISAHQKKKGDLVVGKVLQPWHHDGEEKAKFTHVNGHDEDEFIGCNFSIRRSVLVAIGGFDENFKGVAYRYEREFADRLFNALGSIWYEPSAAVRHLHAGTGGTRSKGDHLTSWNPRHPVGAYYYLFVSKRVTHRWLEMVKRLGGSVRTKHHLRKPWYVPVTICSEILGFLWAAWLRVGGPRLLDAGSAVID